MRRARPIGAMLLLGAVLAASAAAGAQSTVTSWSFGLDLSAMSAPSPATQGAMVAQCRLLSERKAEAAGATGSQALADLQEECMRGFGTRSR